MFFLGVHKLPDPVLKENGHYEFFDTVYGAVYFLRMIFKCHPISWKSKTV